MLTLLFIILMFGIFGKMIGLAFRATWGITKIFFSPDIPSPCLDRISPGRFDLHSTSPSCDSWDYHAGIDVIYC